MVRHNWGDELACFRDGQSVRWMPCRWTSLAAPDPFLLASAGRAWFRPADLVRLSDLVAELQARALVGEEAKNA